MDKKEENGQNEWIRQKERAGFRILSSVNEHHRTNICNMVVNGSANTEWVDLLRMKRLSKNAKILVRGTIGAVGYDLSSAKAVFIPGHSRVVVQTGLAIGIPVGTYAHIPPCSGLAVKWALMLERV